MKLRDQLAEALADALAEEKMSQADLAREMGLSAKHINHMVNGRAGSLAMYDFAASVLDREWTVTFAYVPSKGNT